VLLDVLIVDKDVDLNVYKESDLFEVDGSGSQEKEGTVDEMHPVCCGTGRRKEEPKKKASSCCSTSSSLRQEASSVVVDPNFNEWVGKSFFPCPCIRMLADLTQMQDPTTFMQSSHCSEIRLSLKYSFDVIKETFFFFSGMMTQRSILTLFFQSEAPSESESAMPRSDIS